MRPPGMFRRVFSSKISPARGSLSSSERQSTSHQSSARRESAIPRAFSRMPPQWPGSHWGEHPRISRPVLFAVVVQHARRWWAFYAGNRAQIFVDGDEVVVAHVLKDGPRHYLEEVAVEGRRQA